MLWRIKNSSGEIETREFHKRCPLCGNENLRVEAGGQEFDLDGWHRVIRRHCQSCHHEWQENVYIKQGWKI